MREINRNNQRLDAVIDCVKTLLKGEHKHKKFVSNLTTTVAKGKTSSNLAANTKLKSTNRLIERV